MQNLGSSLVWQDTQMLLPRSTTIGPWAFIQPSGCGISRPWWQSEQTALPALPLWQPSQSLGVTLPSIGTLISSGGAPPTWQTLQSSGSCSPSWQRAQIGILFWDTRATSSCVPGWLMLAWQVMHWYPASRSPVWLTRMLL